jgi:hypothetical protein
MNRAFSALLFVVRNPGALPQAVMKAAPLALDNTSPSLW